MVRTISLEQHRRNLAKNRAIQVQKKREARKSSTPSSTGTVTRRGKVIYDPKTGAAIGSTYTDVQTGQTQSTFTADKKSGIVVHGGSAFKVKRGERAPSPVELKQAAGQKLTRKEQIQLKNIQDSQKKEVKPTQGRYIDRFLRTQNLQSESRPTDEGGRPISTPFQVSLFQPTEFKPEERIDIKPVDTRPTFQGQTLTAPDTSTRRQETINFLQKREQEIKEFQDISKQREGSNLATYKIGDMTFFQTDKNNVVKKVLRKKTDDKSLGTAFENAYVKPVKIISQKISDKYFRGSNNPISSYLTLTRSFTDDKGKVKYEGGNQAIAAKTIKNIAAGYILGSGVSTIIKSSKLAGFASQAIAKPGMIIYSAGIPFRVVSAKKRGGIGEVVLEFSGDLGFMAGIKYGGINLRDIKKVKVDPQTGRKLLNEVFQTKRVPNTPPNSKVINANYKMLSKSNKKKFLKAFFDKFKKLPDVFKSSEIRGDVTKIIKKGSKKIINAAIVSKNSIRNAAVLSKRLGKRGSITIAKTKLKPKTEINQNDLISASNRYINQLKEEAIKKEEVQTTRGGILRVIRAGKGKNFLYIDLDKLLEKGLTLNDIEKLLSERQENFLNNDADQVIFKTKEGNFRQISDKNKINNKNIVNFLKSYQQQNSLSQVNIIKGQLSKTISGQKLKNKLESLQINMQKTFSNTIPKIKAEILSKNLQKILSQQSLNQKINQRLKNKQKLSKKQINEIINKFIIPEINFKKLDIEDDKKIKEKIKNYLSRKYLNFYTPTLTGLGLKARRISGRFAGTEIRGSVIPGRKANKPIKVKKHKRKTLKNKNFVRRHRRRKPRK